jgi:adenylate cyclase
MRARRLRRQRIGALVAVALGSAAIALVAYSTDLLRRQDARFAIRGTQAAPSDLAVVKIDAPTFRQLGETWPFPRHLHAQLIDRLRRDGARAIAYDVQFTEPTTRREDDALIEAVARARGRIILSTTEVSAHGRPGVLGGGGILRRIGARAGSAIVKLDPDGVLRRIPVSHGGLAGFAVATVEAATGRKVSGARSGGGHSAWVDYRGPPGTIPTYSFSRVLRGQVPASEFRDKIVIVGAGAPSLQDTHTTPTSGEKVMSGAEVEANAIWTVQHGFPLRSVPRALDLAVILLLALAPAFASWRLKPPAALAVALGLAALYLIAAQLAFDAGRILTVVYPLGALALSTVGALAVTTAITAFERQWVRDTFSRFVPEAVVEDVLARTDENFRLGAVRCVGTVLFSDLRGFTSFAERLEPNQVAECLNHYLTEMSEAIRNHGGTLVSYMADGIMAVFGMPIDQPDHADRALATSREMLSERLPRFNEWIREQGFGEGFRMAIGLNSGEVMSGQVGSEWRMEYAAVGDTTNAAARLEEMTKGTPYCIFIAESTKESLHSEQDGLSYVDEMPVRGREAPIRIWTLSSAQEPRN